MNSRNVGNIPARSVQGKHTKHSIPEDAKQLIRDHIESVPKIDSHYCRADTTRQYMESSINIAKLYKLYVNLMQEKGKTAVKQSLYRHIFCTEYNIYFQRPKKDRCDLCELVKLNEMEETQLDEKTKINYEKHMVEKKICRQERNLDRESKERAVLCFDLQNVLTCPKAEVSKFFYKSKLSVYNLTAHLSLSKQVYCAVWAEHLIGRTGNDIASALYRILNQVVEDHPSLTELILWCDSYVPQNRNSIISFAITRLLWEGQTNLKTITIKYSVPGHSCVQEIDATHSTIERVLDKAEYYSPLSLIRILLKVNTHRPYKIIQTQLKDFMNFQTVSSLHGYDRVPFSKVSSLQFRKSTPHIVYYKISHSENSFTECEVQNEKIMETALQSRLKSATTTSKVALSANKAKSLTFMLKWMPLMDQNYYKAILPEQGAKTVKKKVKKNRN
nr:unnamed protein product [Callosobruchus chinensis]